MYYYALTALLAFLAGMIVARMNDVLSMFRSDTKVKDKKVLMFVTVAAVVGTFAFTYIKASGVKGPPDVGWGWVALIFLTVLAFLAPDAFVKLSNTVGNVMASKYSSAAKRPDDSQG